MPDCGFIRLPWRCPGPSINRNLSNTESMILTVKPDTKQQKRIKSLMEYTNEKTATKAILFAAINYEEKLERIRKLEEDLNSREVALEYLREKVQTYFRTKERAAQDVQEAGETLLKWGVVEDE